MKQSQKVTLINALSYGSIALAVNDYLILALLLAGSGLVLMYFILRHRQTVSPASALLPAIFGTGLYLLGFGTIRDISTSLFVIMAMTVVYNSLYVMVLTGCRKASEEAIRHNIIIMFVTLCVIVLLGEIGLRIVTASRYGILKGFYWCLAIMALPVIFSKKMFGYRG